MKKFNTLLTYVSSNRIWLITLGCLDLFFAFLAWVAYPGDFLSLVGLMIFVSLAAFVIPFVISIHKRSKIDAAFRRFLLEPDDTNEYLLCESAPASMRPYIHELAHHLRMQEGYVNEQQLKVANYESYIENWVHEIKKPLSLMTLLLDNRKVEMSPLVHTRMLYVRDHVRQNVEQILYFSRLGAAHKDCYFEPILILETCESNELTADGSSILHSEEDYLLLSYVVDSNIEITKELKDGGWDHLILTNPQWIDRFGDPSKLKPVEYGSLANSMQEFLDVQMPILTADGNVLPDGVGLYQYDGETLLAFPVHVALGAAEPIEAKNPLIILVDKPAQSLKASSCMLPLTSSGNVLFAEGEKLQESFDESKLIDYGSIEEFQMNH